ncbi:hypothetical protein [Streptomyces coelicoflavus]|uniref:hypothetical protein n=1 Tax=Streptomyces coelicoflavus TaxID=285562 RepID=UPI001EF19ACA|nr:hypothetical protein [Streptomyces coelicoflavus]
MVWGPAEFTGLPPRWLIGEGLFAGVLGAGLIVGAGVFGAWTGESTFAAGEVGLACALGLVLHLLLVRAGRAMVGIVAVLAVGLAMHTPQAAAGVVLTARGQERSVVVTSVQASEEASGARGRYLCSVEGRDGAPSTARIWRGCTRSVRPGDSLALVYDPKGLVPPRGVEGATSIVDVLRSLAGWVVGLVVACVTAVVRSFRLPDRPVASGSDHPGGRGATQQERP